MKKYRFLIRSEWVTEMIIEAENSTVACEEMAGYIEDGGTGDKDKGYWNTREWDDPDEVCQHCGNDVPSERSTWQMPCCQAWLEESKAKVAS